MGDFSRQARSSDDLPTLAMKAAKWSVAAAKHPVVPTWEYDFYGLSFLCACVCVWVIWWQTLHMIQQVSDLWRIVWMLHVSLMSILWWAMCWLKMARKGSGSSDPIGLVSGDFHDGTEKTRECLKPSTVLWKIRKIEVVGVVCHHQNCILLRSSRVYTIYTDISRDDRSTTLELRAVPKVVPIQQLQISLIRFDEEDQDHTRQQAGSPRNFLALALRMVYSLGLTT